MAFLNLYVTKSKYEKQLPVKDGNLVFVDDSNTICLDFNGARYRYNAIQIFDTDEQRAAHTSVLDGFYYVKETNIVWSFSNGSWKQISPDNLKPNIFAHSIDDFPKKGKADILYIADDAIYRWDNLTDSYLMVSNLTNWNEL